MTAISLTTLPGITGLSDGEARALASSTDLDGLMSRASRLRDAGFPHLVTYSRKVFIPLTKLCRDVCHYCTFAQPHRAGTKAFLTRDEVLAIARAGVENGCHEALFTLGDKPELRWEGASAELERLGHATTISYLRSMAELVVRETGLLPHLNPGVMTASDLAVLRPVSASMGLMLEGTAPGLTAPGGPHHGCPDKAPAVRLACLEAAGEAAVPVTSGLLIGLGETRAERIDALLALRDLHRRYSHVQEIIIQNFVPKPGTRMARIEAAAEEDHLWTIAVARLVMGAEMSIQAPPNLARGALRRLAAAGINDWGGVSPVTRDHVNPEAPWPAIEALAAATRDAGKTLAPRLTIYPRFVQSLEAWTDPVMRRPVLRLSDALGYAREDGWCTGSAVGVPVALTGRIAPPDARIGALCERAIAGQELGEDDVTRLLTARGDAAEHVLAWADRLRSEVCGDTVTYVVTRNINYTNVCTLSCRFCAFSKGRTHEDLRGKPYDLSLSEFSRRVDEAWDRGATEVCLQGGIHPDYDGNTYLRLVAAAREAAPGIHIHAFSPLEVTHGARTLGLSLEAYLGRLKDAGLSTLPGTAAEILDDEIRDQLCKDKIDTEEWFAVMEAGHRLGLGSTSTMMFGHIERPHHWTRHLLRLRSHQVRFGGFTEFVPLPFVAREAPIFLKGEARNGPTWREALLVHAVARLVLHPHIRNIQTSWVKMGPQGVSRALRAGVNDLGGTLMDESITRAAGAVHGQEFSPARMEETIRANDRIPRQRTTNYGTPCVERVSRSLAAPALLPKENTPLVPRRRLATA